MTIVSNPPGALVWLNDQEIGRTPVTKEFIWYGDYQVELRKEGYDALLTHQMVKAPWWQWVPFDFFAEFLPATDRQHYSFTMRKTNPNVDPQGMETRGEGLSEKLQSGMNYREKPPTTRKSKATTKESTRPTTKGSTNPTTEPGKEPGAEPTGF
jgi:hypothetical protein